MIPVTRQPEPVNFDRDVRQKGLAWIKKRNLPKTGPPPANTPFQSYWTKITEQIHERYEGVCAYYSCYIHLSSGAVTTDHFVPKTKETSLVYEWSNYRLASLGANRLKRDFMDVLDPFSIQPETFHLHLLSGKVFVNPNAGFDAQYISLAESTIARLQLNSHSNRNMRLDFINQYISGEFTSPHLLRVNPFVYFEMQRQGQL